MSWRYKRYAIHPDHVVEVGRVDTNFMVFVDEVSGGLNEHNFTDSAFPPLAVADGVALRVHRSLADDVLPGVDGYSDPDAANWVTVTGSDSWQTFPDDGLTLTFTAQSTQVYVCASFNLHCGLNRTFSTPGGVRTPEFQQLGYGYLVVLRLDGAPLYSTLLGSGDSATDDFRARDFAAVATLESIYAGTGGPQGGGGLSGARLPVTVDAVLDILPGEHTVEVAVMNIRGSMRTFESNDTWIGQRTTFALELVR